MKRLTLTTALILTSASAFAQGTFAFQNLGLGANAPVYSWDGTTKLGNTFEADLYWAPGTVTQSSALTALNQPVFFSGSGYFFGGIRTLPGTTAETITAQVRVWEGTRAPSWIYATTVPNAQPAESALFSLTLVTGIMPPNSLVNLTSFQIPTVPEPSTLALSGVGLAAMLILRRRR